MELKRTLNEVEVLKCAWFEFLVYPIGIFIFLVGNQSENATPFIPIGIIGLLSTLTVIVTCLLSKKLTAPIFTLIFWRAICDMMIAIGFLTMPRFQNFIEENHKNLCSPNTSCNNNDDNDDWILQHQEKCLPMSLWLEFFQMASETWLLCITYDLVVTISNPFASFSYRVKYYHIFTWTLACLSLIVMTTTNSHGIYYIEVDLESKPLCWIKNSDNLGSFSIRPWVFLLIPLFIYYSYAMYVIRCVRDMLDPHSTNTKNSSLLKTHFHRLFALDSNNRTIKIYIGYWLFFILIAILLLISVSTSHFATNSSKVSKSLAYLVLLCIGGKGYGDLVVFSSILLSRSYKVCITGSQQGEDYFNLNKGLKFQLMTFITSGLKQANEEIQWNDFESHDSRLWSITVKPNPEKFQSHGISSVIHDEYLTPEQYREYLSEIDTEHPDIVVLVERTTSIANRETFSSIFRDDSTVGKETNYNKSSSSSNNNYNNNNNNNMDTQLLDVEITSRKSVDETILSKTIIIPEKSFIERLLLLTGLYLHDTGRDAMFEEYLPDIFHEIRKSRGVYHIYQEVFQNIDLERVGVSESGASGAIFFFSSDNQFIAKSCTRKEMNHVKSVALKLKTYFEDNPNTLITQIYGAYRLKMYAAQIFFIVTRNVLWNPPPNLSPLRVEIYDLKGSTYKRSFVSPPKGTLVKCRHCSKSYIIGSYEIQECTSYRRIHEPTGVRKDNDFYHRLPLLEGEYDRLMGQVTKDLYFLSDELQVIDYSWLVGISKVVQKTETNDVILMNESEDNDSLPIRYGSGNYLSILPSQQVVDGEWKYGIIDYQQEWNLRKKFEMWFKCRILGQKNISCMPPKYYRDRQYKFIESTLKRISLGSLQDQSQLSLNQNNTNQQQLQQQEDYLQQDHLEFQRISSQRYNSQIITPRPSSINSLQSKHTTVNK